jgi:hypothetical protein
MLFDNTQSAWISETRYPENPHREGFPYLYHRDAPGSSVGLSPGILHQYSEINIEKLPPYVDALRTWWVYALGTFTSTQKSI